MSLLNEILFKIVYSPDSREEGMSKLTKKELKQLMKDLNNLKRVRRQLGGK